ncbi:MAG: shikimate kinase [Proteobacteria bacterium]|nr:shikimate kinase [Pseudomonadota bacterium]
MRKATLNPEPMNLNNLFLIGYRCTGKTTVGRCLAEDLGWLFIDTDSLIVIQQQMSIKEIVGAYGWEKFRQMERAMLKTVCASRRQVVATGGGIVLNEDNVKLMKKSGKTIWLKATYETIKNRMIQDKDSQDFRPALTLNDSLLEIEETLQSRAPLYQKALDLFVDTDENDIHAITNIIIEKLNSIYPTFFDARR